MSTQRVFFSSLAASFFALAVSARASVLIVNPDVSTSQANIMWAGNVAGDRTESGIANNPLSWTSGANHANANFSFTNSAFSISNINNARFGGFQNQEHVRVAFQVDVATAFSFSGQYINTNAADFSGRASLQNALSVRSGGGSDPISTTSLFSPSFGTQGTGSSLNIPTVSGLLTPGHTYVWDVFVGSLASGNPNPGSTATGFLTLAFTPVPLPKAAWQIVFLLGAFGIFHWRSRRAAHSKMAF